jgi:ATP-dependent helicase/nuclease subunit A
LSKPFSIYRSSAGSGKTRTLAKEYLKLALTFKDDYFKHILAVTFTNKASQEMKDRILAYLDAFAKGENNELAKELKEELKLDDQTFQEHSRAAQAAILHGYAQFSISTIDAFFQKVIRSFTRESGLVGDYRLEVEHDAVLETVIDNLIDELGTNAQLTDWIVDFAKENLENERAWDVRFSLIDFAKEIFREEFKAIEDELTVTTSQPGFFKALKEKLWAIKGDFIAHISKPALATLQVIQHHRWNVEDFSYGKNSGLLTFLNAYAYERNLSKLKPPGERIRNHFSFPENWASKKSPHAKDIYREASQGLVNNIQSIVDGYDTRFEKALTAEIALKNFYVFGLISDIARKLKEYKDENSMMMLADAPKFLNGVIQDSDTPFIYEKVGSFYRNYLIDEFQDTSGMQWKNFQPLITNSLDQGYKSFVVGDVKQAIYRWRGGDLNLLQNQINNLIGDYRIESQALDCNYRSNFEIVNFNNHLFETAASMLSNLTGTTIPTEAYLHITQKPFKTSGGYVNVNFIEETTEDRQLKFSTQEESDESQTGKWREQAMQMIPVWLEDLQINHGVQLKDIAILVRKNDEGQKIANHLLQYRVSDQAKSTCRYDVVSNESLRIDGASSVNLLLGAMQYLLNGEDAIARAQLGFEFARIHERSREIHEVFSVTNQNIFENNLPEAFAKQKPSLKKLGLIELTETLIEIFALGNLQGELIYLQAFQDLVLDFCNRERNDLGAFLEWWEDNKHKKSIQISGDVDAAQILTIHKSKGLQFKYVLIPFCSWALDHDAWQAPNLWVKVNEAPFADAGYIPVKYQKTLEQSYFKHDYAAERIKIYLDNLNLLYVALTRAEQGLIVACPAITVRGTKDSVAGILYQSILTNETLHKNWNAEKFSFECGSIATVNHEFADNPHAVQLYKYHAANWREKLVIKQSGAGYFKDAATHYTNINYGLQMHAVLSKMKYSEDIDSAIHDSIIEGLLTNETTSAVRAELNDLLTQAPMNNWFSKEWEVYTEIPILLPGGKENRIDRLLVKDKKAMVIDYKTGERKKTDQQQVLDYMETLRLMNYNPVEGFLIYLKEKEVVEVKYPTTKSKIVKKVINTDQLSLGLN